MDNRKGSNTLQVVIITIILTATFCYILYKIHGYSMVLENGVNYAATQIANTNNQEFYKLKRVKNLLDSEYIGEYKDEEIMDSAISGLLRGTNDPYAAYYNKEAFDRFYTQTEGTYAGIGIYLTYDETVGLPIIIMPLEGSPAEEAGLQTGDYIYSADNVTASSSNYEEITDAIKGRVGTKVKLVIIRNYGKEDAETLEFEVERKDIELYKVTDKVFEENIGYINLSNFDETTYTNFKSAYDRMLEQGIKGLIIDVRNNPGGILQICAKIVDELIPEGKLVYTVDKKGKENAIMSDANRIEIPLVVLVNSNSASASEVLACAVKDYEVGKIVGNKTYGKGVVQSLRPLGDGSYIKITTEEYFSPKGNKINGEGVKPDIVASLPDGVRFSLNLSLEEDTQLQVAIDTIKSMIQ